MGRFRLGFAIVALTLAASSAAADEPPEDGKNDGPKCLKVTSEALYRAYGYDHLVHLDNTCKKARSCRVKTDVTPTATVVVVEPGTKETVVTRRGSPAREFKPDVQCEISGKQAER